MRSYNYLVVIGIYCLLFGCQQKETRKQGLDIYQVYGDVLDQLMTTRYYRGCLTIDRRIDSISTMYEEGKFDPELYHEIEDSVINARKRILPKCILDYDTGSIYTKSTWIDSSTTNSFLKQVFAEKFVKENFNTSFKVFTDSLSNPFKDFHKIKIDYLNIIPYQKSNGLFGKGLGRFTFSKIIFNSTFDKAILYYDIQIHGKNGKGEALFIELEDNRWRIKEHEEFWIS